MKFWVAVTDNRWFRYLSNAQPDEVNFWQPTATPPFTSVPVGLPFLFKLKRPHNHIAGGGYYVTYTKLPLPLAWDVFGQKNGCSSLDELRDLINPLIPGGGHDGDIGCAVLASPFFFHESDWIADPLGWSPNIVRGKMYDSNEVDGREIWHGVQERLLPSVGIVREPVPIEKYGAPTTIRPRIGQSSFRVLVTDAYQRRCAITGEHTLVALEAAHIVPYSGEGSHDVRNGLLLRADFHRLFDFGLVSVTPDLRIRVSPRIRDTWFNGKVYYDLDTKPLSVVPTSPSMRPDPDRLNWHFKNCFQP